MGSPSRRLVLDGLLVALGLAVHQAEAALPPLLPGVKPGLANVFGLVAFVALGWRDAAAVTLLRVFLGGLFSGLGLAFLCSLGGSLAALAALALLGRFVPDRLSLEGLSVAQATLISATSLCPVSWKAAAATIRMAALMNSARDRAIVLSSVEKRMASRLPSGVRS